MTPEQQEIQTQISENNNFSMLAIFSHQSQMWGEAMQLTKSYRIFDNNLRRKILDFSIKARELNVSITRQLASKKDHNNTTAAVSKFIEVLAKSSEKEGYNLIEILNYFEKKSQVVFPDDKVNPDLMEKLTLISAMNDKLIDLDLKKLQKFHDKLVNTNKTPTKKKDE